MAKYKIIGMILATLAFLPFLFLTIFFFRATLLKVEYQNNTASFSSVDAVIVESKMRYIKRMYGDPGPSHKPFIKYSYIVNGRNYESTRLGYGVWPEGETSNQGGSEASYISYFPVGKRVKAYYNPHNPSEAVLTTKKFNPMAQLIIISGIGVVPFILIFGILWAVVFKEPKQRAG